MSDPKFTPGPWRLAYRTDGRCFITDSDRRYLSGEIARPEDWHLIATAPDLYAALDRITTCTWPPTQDDVDIARAALAKARGE